MNPKFLLMTIDEAKIKSCPFKKDFDYCNPSNCMAWKEIQSRIEREDHSESRLILNNEAIKRRTYVKRSGGPGCSGIIYIEARGYCRRIYTFEEMEVE
jgi:hypothetical protein